MSKELFPNLVKGGLHRSLGVKQGKKLTSAQLEIKPNDSPLVKKRKQFAINARKFKH